MARNKLTISFDGFEEIMEKLDRATADTKKITERALQKSYDAVTPAIKSAIEPHHLTGQTEQSLAENERVEWEGTKAYIKVGFNISTGGLASIFLMYGTPKSSQIRSYITQFMVLQQRRKLKKYRKKYLKKN